LKTGGSTVAVVREGAFHPKPAHDNERNVINDPSVADAA